MMLDWKSLGLKCGLEIHQQLEGKKLFCKCPTLIREDPAHFTIKRRLRAVAGEAGDVDVAALHEMQKGKWFSYEGFEDSTCLVELDESPPEQVNDDALRTALQVSLLLNAVPVDQVHMMRKTVVDGSNTSGFQRTALVARNGVLTTEHGTVTIPTISLEEDASRIIKNSPTDTLYRLDRLGIPLIEIGTGPEIKDPDHCKEVAEALGLLLRATGRAKRGLGTIRQDVNVSIAGGTRIEIKGAQDLKLVPTLVAYEVVRQKSLLELKDELVKRNVSFDSSVENLTHILAPSTSTVIKNALAAGGVVLAVKFPQCHGLIGKEIQPGRRFGTELSDRAKAHAGVGGLFHSDELPKYGITQGEVDTIRKALQCHEHDAFILVADKEEKAVAAMRAILARAKEALHGVPKEVRKANEDGTTTFLRPMPGAARMYPETDIRPIALTAEAIKSIPLPELINVKIDRYQQWGLGRDLAELAAKSEQPVEFERFVKQYPGVKPAYIAEVFFSAEKTIKRQYAIEISPTLEDFDDLFSAVNNNTISKESVLEILKQGKRVNDVLKHYAVLSDKELLKELQHIVAANKGLPFNALIGKAMATLRGKAAGEKIVAELKKL
ncbi:Glu-tRNA(Gln) amidotransferase subunit GatE, partial [Candidatus Woesearchaeota archaeon]|nr:Glu-tRNA(Gln) amidotransferase subunit GatE [Candidatus Woesearchaeota archaeon]